MNPVSKKHSERGLNDLAAALATEVIGLSPHGRVRKPGRRMRVQPLCRAVGLYWGFLPLAEGDEPVCQIVR